MKGNLKDGVDVDGRAVAARRLELPFGQRLHGSLIQAIIEMAQKLDGIDVAGLADHGRESHGALDAVRHGGSNILWVNFAERRRRTDIGRRRPWDRIMFGEPDDPAS